MDILNRCSIVIRIPAELQADLAELQLQIRRRAGADLVRWTPSNELVLTLLSLGEIGVGQMAQIAATLPTIASGHRALDLQLEGLGGPTISSRGFFGSESEVTCWVLHSFSKRSNTQWPRWILIRSCASSKRKYPSVGSSRRVKPIVQRWGERSGWRKSAA